MRRNLTLRTLQALKEMSIEGVELVEAVIIAGYGASYFRIQQVQERLREERFREKSVTHEKQKQLRNYQKLVSKLKSQGLLAVKQEGDKKLFDITKKGLSKLASLELKGTRRLPDSSLYSVSPSKQPVIISFDIPEKQRRKRGWVREVLKRLGLKMIHKSVWIGMVRIPEEFFEDLKLLGLLDHIEIFEVGKSGTLRSII